MNGKKYKSREEWKEIVNSISPSLFNIYVTKLLVKMAM